MKRAEEGFVDVPGGRVWYRIVASGDRPPLLVLHGGPGMPHDYLEPLEALADERSVVFYDQLGCGNSEKPDDVELWNIERFVEELDVIVKWLRLEHFIILGHSWGSMLATDYMLTNPSGPVGLILAGPCLNVEQWLRDASAYRRALPEEVRKTLDRHEAAGSIESEEYEEATAAFYRRHFCRLDPWPAALQRTWDRIALPVYNTMWGPTEFRQTGNLGGYDRTDRLHEIALPTLFTCGRFDEASPEATVMYQSLLPGSELVVFEKSSHTPHLEEQESYIREVRHFLNRI
ncbi:MAG: proline iminopeptidase-family hydrolase [Anaerolineae bacterium]|nr:MAG: proline iminopeptidase-family hydrolase [Anaerolineae bacterium]